jgi:hypothetical protein
MEACGECVRLLEEMRNKTQARVVAENALVLSGTDRGFSDASKALDCANREWLHAALEYQDHMQERHPRAAE